MRNLLNLTSDLMLKQLAPLGFCTLLILMACAQQGA